MFKIFHFILRVTKSFRKILPNFFVIDYLQTAVIILLSAYLVQTYDVPQVYEDHDDFPIYDDKKNLKEIESFNYPPAFQKDQLKWRYFQQQIADAKNTAKYKQDAEYNGRVLQPEGDYYSKITFKSVPSWRPVHPKFLKNSSSAFKRNPIIKDSRTLQLRRSDPKYAPLRRKSRNTDKQQIFNDSLMVESNMNIETRELQNQAEGVPVYMSNDHNTKKENNINHLNELLSKQPNVHLQGIQEILTTQPSPTPFHVTVINGQNESNNIEPQPTTIPVQLVTIQGLSQLQEEFNKLSQVQYRDALKKAHEYAAAEVEAQHEAIILANNQAEKAALDQIQRAQAQAETVAYVNQIQNTQHLAATTTPVQQQQPPNFKLQNALQHSQKQAEAYQHHTLKTHLPRINKKDQFKEESKRDTKNIPINDDNDVSNATFFLECCTKYSVKEFTKRTKREIACSDKFDFKLNQTKLQIERRSFHKHHKKRRSTHKKHHHHQHDFPKFQPIYIPEKHHYYHFLPEQHAEEYDKDSHIVVNINNHNDNEKEKHVTRRKPKRKKRRPARFSKPLWHRSHSRNINKKLYKAFHKLGVPFK